MADRRDPFDPQVEEILRRGRKGQPAPPEPEPEERPKQRKKRSDATGQKSDYHKGTSTLTVRLSDGDVERVKAMAKKNGQSVNAWLQELIVMALKNGQTLP